MKNQDFVLSAKINNQWQFISIQNDHFSLKRTILKLDQKLRGLALSKNKFFVLYDPTNDGKKFNNIDAYDYHGNHLYNIGDIIPEKQSYLYVSINDTEVSTSEGHEFLICSTFDCINYIVDITEDKFIKSVFTK